MSAGRPGARVHQRNRALVALQVEDRLEDAGYDVEHTVSVCAVPCTTVITVLIPAPEAFAEVVAVLDQVDVVTVVPVGGVLICVAVAVVEAPTVLAIRLAGEHALLVTQVHRLAQHVRGVLIRVVISTTAVVAIAVRRIGKALSLPQTQLILTQSLHIALLESILRGSTLSLELPLSV